MQLKKQLTCMNWSVIDLWCVNWSITCVCVCLLKHYLHMCICECVNDSIVDLWVFMCMCWSTAYVYVWVCMCKCWSTACVCECVCVLKHYMCVYGNTSFSQLHGVAIISILYSLRNKFAGIMGNTQDHFKRYEDLDLNPIWKITRLGQQRSPG